MRPGFRQSMASLHTWSGLLVGWVLFAVFLTGTASYLRPEITRWMRPEVSAAPFDPAEALAASVRTMGRLAPDSPAWFITPADAREPVITAYWRAPPGSGRAYRQTAIDPHDGAMLQDRDTRGGLFFYRFHFELYHLPVLWGRWIVSLCAAMMLVAIVSGVVTHRRIFADFFTFRPGRGLRAWMDGHAVAAVLALPYHLMITYTGLVTLMAMILPWGVVAAYGPGGAGAFGAEIAGYTAPRASGRKAPLTDIAPMLAEATARWGTPPARMSVINPGDETATVMLARGASGAVADHRAGMAFAGATGAELAEWGDGGPAMRSRAVLLGLHEGLFAGPLLRGLFVLSGALGTAMVATGCVLWAVKIRGRGPGGFGLRLVEVLNVATIAGLPTAMAALLWANRLLPVRLTDRAEWEIEVFFAVWAAGLLHAILRRGRWGEAWVVAALAWGLLPALNALTTTRHLGASLPEGDWGMAGMDLGFLALGLAFAAIARVSIGARAGRSVPGWRPA